MSLVTRCPKCESRFLIEPEQLSEHDGLVRCGECSHIFDGAAELENQLPTLTRRLPPAVNHFANVPNLELDSDLDEDFDEPLGPKLEWDPLPTPIPPIVTPSAHAPVMVGMPAAVAPQVREQAQATAPAVAPVSVPSVSPVSVASQPVMPEIHFGADREPQLGVETEPSVMRHRSAASAGTAATTVSTASAIATSATAEPRLSIMPGEDPPVRGEVRRPQHAADTHQSEPDLTGSDGMGMFGILLWGIGCFFAIILLCGQLLYIYRNDVATNVPVLRPTLETLCARLGCEISLNRHLDRITIEGTALDQTGAAAQEGQPSEQLLRLTMRNRYEKSQPWPHLMIELTDPSSTVVVRKVVAPYQYLPPTLLDQPFAAQQEVTLALPVTIMGLQINGFNVQKFFP